ncbi:MAG: tetratricopeptide repeat protein, partial [Ruthenibacterium sp.]
DGLGRGVNADIAHQWYAKALAAFHKAEEIEPKPYTEYRIGKLYHAGLGTEQDDEKAARWFAPAAGGGNKYAQYSLGGLYYKGNGVVQNYETAHTLYAESDQKNFPYASYELAKMHRDGVGTIKNTAKADECFQKAFVGFVALEAQSHDDKLTGREAAKAPVEPLRSRSGRACAMEANADK